MPLLDLKDISQTLEILRRTRRDMPEGNARNAIDSQIVHLATSINAVVAEDERLVRSREAEAKLLVSKPSNVNWDMLKLGGQLATMIAKVIAGVAVDQIWKEYKP